MPDGGRARKTADRDVGHHHKATHDTQKGKTGFSSTDPSQVSPVQQVREPLGPVALNDALTPRLLAEAKHELSQLVARLLCRAEAPVHNVNAWQRQQVRTECVYLCVCVYACAHILTVGRRVGDMLLHEAAKTREVGGDTGNSHNRALGWWRTEHLSSDRQTDRKPLRQMLYWWMGLFYRVCIPTAHSRMETLRGYNHEQSLHNPWAAED